MPYIKCPVKTIDRIVCLCACVRACVRVCVRVRVRVHVANVHECGHACMVCFM